MKPPVFEYHAPESLDEVLALLAEHGDEAKVLAGGQSLVPAMNFRLARPEILIDLGRLSELAGIEVVDQGQAVRIGAMTRQRVVERDETVKQHLPLVHRTMPWVAHPQIRNRGTFGGSLAHADPAAELPAVLLALGGRCLAKSQSGERWIGADDFYTGLFETALRPDELLVSIEMPSAGPGESCAFTEMSRRHGDFALCGVAVRLRAVEGTLIEAGVVLLSVGDGPVMSPSAASVLMGEKPNDDLLRSAAAAVVHDIDPPGDLHATPAFRRHLAQTLTRRALTEAVARISG